MGIACVTIEKKTLNPLPHTWPYLSKNGKIYGYRRKPWKKTGP